MKESDAPTKSMASEIGSLVKFGLSEKEAKAYLACLELGDALASEIALKSGLPRTLTYDIMERLIEIGLISYFIKANKRYFRAARPNELVRVCREKEKAIKDVLPQLEQLRKAECIRGPKVEVYEGVEGMKTIMSDILISGCREYLSYGSSRSSYEIMPAFMDDWHKERIRRRVFMRIIYNNTPQARARVRSGKASLGFARYRFMPINVNSPTATMIYSDKVVLTNWTKHPFAVVIENEEMAKNQKRYFEELWKKIV